MWHFCGFCMPGPHVYGQKRMFFCTDQENTVAGDKDIKQPSSNQSIQPEIQDQSIWGNRTDGDLIRTQPQRLPQPNTSGLERGEEESGKIQNGHVGLSNGSGIHNGVKHVPTDNRKLSAPVSEKMHRKIQSTLSVNSNSSKKSKISSAFSQKPGTSPEVISRTASLGLCHGLVLLAVFYFRIYLQEPTVIFLLHFQSSNISLQNHNFILPIFPLPLSFM
uniref:MyoD family inhibitor domain containing n=1 Tax=Accipiter nisus TaxID=211598 RepID=A0A8B9M4I5_9AVES